MCLKILFTEKRTRLSLNHYAYGGYQIRTVREVSTAYGVCHELQSISSLFPADANHTLLVVKSLRADYEAFPASEHLNSIRNLKCVHITDERRLGSKVGKQRFEWEKG